MLYFELEVWTRQLVAVDRRPIEHVTTISLLRAMREEKDDARQSGLLTSTLRPFTSIIVCKITKKRPSLG